MSILGLVCLTHAQKEEQKISFKTMTKKSFDSMTEPERRKKLIGIYTHNIQVLQNAIDFCHRHDIRSYRLSSSMFPFADAEWFGTGLLESFKSRLGSIGRMATARGIRLTTHPDHFNVLCSEREEVVVNSIRNLEFHDLLMNLLDQPNDHRALINVHLTGNHVGRAKRAIENFNRLSSSVKNRLTFENDNLESGAGTQELYEIFLEIGVPIVFDFHHELCTKKLKSYSCDEMYNALELAELSWHENPTIQLTHLATGANGFHCGKHSDLISVSNDFSILKDVPYIDIEAKHKEIALFDFRKHLKTLSY